METQLNRISSQTRVVAFGGAAIVLTVLTGVVYGRWTQRWGPPPDLQAAATRVDLPRQIGNWQFLEEQPLADEIVRTLECVGHVNRVYVDKSSGAKVNVAVLVGPPGPISVHTPEICYSSRAYEIATSRQKAFFKRPGGESHALWSTTFKSKNAGAEQLRVYYGWSVGERWIASQSPRFEFGGRTLLYKIQLATLVAPSDDKAKDPCKSFMDALIESYWRSTES